MEMVTLPKQNLTPNFIGSWIMNPLSICDELITYFESNQNKQKRGVTAAGENLDSKNSIDIKISPKEIKLPGNEVFEKYFFVDAIAEKLGVLPEEIKNCFNLIFNRNTLSVRSSF